MTKSPFDNPNRVDLSHSSDKPFITNTPRGPDDPRHDPDWRLKGQKLTHERDPLLEERQKTHGSFAQNAEASQAIKYLFNNAGYKGFNPVHTEALDMIALKLSRILSGQADFKDHWDDIAGYAKLASEVCSK